MTLADAILLEARFQAWRAAATHPIGNKRHRRRQFMRTFGRELQPLLGAPVPDGAALMRFGLALAEFDRLLLRGTGTDNGPTGLLPRAMTPRRFEHLTLNRPAPGKGRP
jgi:hypothetical protein